MKKSTLFLWGLVLFLFAAGLAFAQSSGGIGVVPITRGGTAATSASQARLNLGVATGYSVVATNIANLKATSVSGLADGTVIVVLGYAAAGDGGGGMFRYSSASVATDDSGTIIAPNSGSGRWLRQFSGAFNVRWFGAKGDGSTDDTTPIQNTINAVVTAGGGTVMLPPGTYKTTAALSIQADYVTVAGDGATMQPTGAIVTFQVGPSNQTRQFVAFEGLKFNPGATALDVIQFLGGTHECRIHKCWFEAGGGVATAGYGVNFLGGLAFNNNDSIRDCFFRYLNKGIKDGAAQVDLDIQNCRFANIASSAVEIQTGGLARISTCNFESCGTGTTAPGVGIIAIGQASPAAVIGDVSVEFCHFEENGSSAGNQNYDVKIENSRSIRLIGNRFYTGTGYPTKEAIECNNSTAVEVIGCEYDSYSTGAVNLPTTNSQVMYLANHLDSGSEFVSSGANGITWFGHANGNFNVSLGGTDGSNAMAVKDSAGNNVFLVFSDGTIQGKNSYNVKLGDAAGSYGLAVKNSSGTNQLVALSNGKVLVQPNASLPTGGSTSGTILFGSGSGLGIYFGVGAPTVSAGKGSLYLRSDGSASGNRAYINTDGGTSWTSITTGS